MSCLLKFTALCTRRGKKFTDTRARVSSGTGTALHYTRNEKRRGWYKNKTENIMGRGRKLRPVIKKCVREQGDSRERPMKDLLST